MAVQGVAMSDLLDLVNTTMERLPEGRFYHTQDLQKYEALDHWFRENREEYQGGDQVTENIVLSESGQARHTRPYQEDALHMSEVQSRIKAPWCRADTHFVLERAEMLANREPERFVNLVQSRELDALMSLAGELEDWAWNAPSSGDDLHPYGLLYWVPKLNTSYTGLGFWGGSAISGVDAVGNIKPATSNHNQPDISGGIRRWRSFCGGGYDTTNDLEFYYEVNGALVKSMRLTFYTVNFQSPYTVQQLIEGPMSQYRMYCNTQTKVELEELATQQNENLGNDLAPFNGVTAFKRIPIVNIPKLETDSTDPIYFINHSHFYPYVREGDYMRRSEPIVPSNRHNTIVTWIDLSYNYICTKRREQAVLSKTGDHDTSGYDEVVLT